MKFLNCSQALLIATLVTSSVFPGASLADPKDFGLEVESRLNNQANRYFGFHQPLEESASPRVPRSEP